MTAAQEMTVPNPIKIKKEAPGQERLEVDLLPGSTLPSWLTLLALWILFSVYLTGVSAFFHPAA